MNEEDKLRLETLEAMVILAAGNHTKAADILWGAYQRLWSEPIAYKNVLAGETPDYLEDLMKRLALREMVKHAN